MFTLTLIIDGFSILCLIGAAIFIYAAIFPNGRVSRFLIKLLKRDA